MRKLRRGLPLLGIFSALLFLFAYSNANTAVAYSAAHGLFQSSSIELAISVNPVNIEPGQQAAVTVSVKNHSTAPVEAEVQISFPASISARLGELPAGTIYNAQTEALTWTPVIPGQGAEVQLSLPIVAQVAVAQTPEQQIEVVLRAADAEIRHQVSFWIGLAPEASIRTNPPQVAVGQPVQLVGSVTGPGPVAQLWSLGDGRIVEAQDPTVVYPAPGIYELIFQASTPMGVISARGSVNVVSQPIARFHVSEKMTFPGATIYFFNDSGGQQPLSFLWDFGDGAVSTETSPTHAFALPGSYDVRLFVTGNGGQSESVQTVLVGSAPVADFVIADSVDAGSVVVAQAFADETVDSIHWDMGDGREYEGAVIEHVYWSSGDHMVTVTVANQYGELRLQRSVRVNAGRHFLFLPLISNSASATINAGAELAPPLDEFAQQESSASSAGQEQGTVTVVQEVGTPEPEQSSNFQEELQPIELSPDLSAAEQLLAYINEARRVNGLGVLNLVPELNAAAQSHADDMALNGFTGHMGSDGSVPALRIQLSGYPGGYAGEATAWGMPQAIEPVRYWLTSPSHRTILLDPTARDVGVGFSQNYSAPSIWYWSAEFASLDLPVIRVPLPVITTPAPIPVLTLLGPPSGGEFTLSTGTNLIFTWSWPVSLSPDERFAIYLDSQGRTTQIGTVSQPQDGDQYVFTTSAGDVPARPGQQSWYVLLESTLTGEVSEQSETRPIVFIAAP